jgi:hypothetical protein
VAGGKCCLRMGLTELTAPECEKSTGTAMAQKMRRQPLDPTSRRYSHRYFYSFRCA